MQPQDETGPRQPASTNSAHSDVQDGRKRPRQPPSDPRYPRKRSSRACHVCRARKTKCDNAQPICGFCASLNIPCSYDATEKDHSSFDPASLEILRQLGQVINTQDHLLQLVRSVTALPSHGLTSSLPPSGSTHVLPGHVSSLTWDVDTSVHGPSLSYMDQEWPGQQSESTSTTPAASAAAVRWFGLLANDASHDALREADMPLGVDGGFLDPSDEDDMTPLQRATRIIDSQPSAPDLPLEAVSPVTTRTSIAEESLWQAPEDISLLAREQVLLAKFLYRICPTIDLFDPARTFSTRVPHLAVRNAGLLNAILALSSYQSSLTSATKHSEQTDRNHALQYYYQTLHYVQKAMRYSTYQNSQELMATTLIVSTYEMLRGSRKDWQQHLQGVFWILRSRQIEVEAPSLESTTWWAWLRQDIWVAFREKRRTYSTWSPKKSYAELDSHELASRAVWILAQVINFCAADPPQEAEGGISGRLRWAEALKGMLDEWQTHLTVEFSPLPAAYQITAGGFQSHKIHQKCFGLAMQIHHVARLLVYANEPCLAGLESFMKRQKTMEESINMVCGIGMTLVKDDASSMLCSQCLFIAGLFIQNTDQRIYVLEMLATCRDRCGWPTPSLGSELEQIWENPGTSWRTTKA